MKHNNIMLNVASQNTILLRGDYAQCHGQSGGTVFGGTSYSMTVRMMNASKHGISDQLLQYAMECMRRIVPVCS